jgi:methylthioribose-1-phosphate isomerase
MNVGGTPYRTIWRDATGALRAIDQTRLPYAFEILTFGRVEDVALAIRTMQVRGAPLIGVAAAYGLALALAEDASDANLNRAESLLAETRPTAVNLRWALAEVRRAVLALPVAARAAAAAQRAAAIAEDDVDTCRRIGGHALPLLRDLSATNPGHPVNVLTHCNAGWLATTDFGTALSGVYQAHDAGIPVHVWVDETRPRSQGLLTAWELAQHGVPHTLIPDNAGGHLMQHGEVDLVIVGSDRTTARGDVCNKIGTYLKALAAHDNGVPFYAALPHSTLDFKLDDGVREIPIEERSESEMHEVRGTLPSGEVASVRISPKGTRAANPAFDVTPARLVTGIITERGVCAATRGGLLELYPEQRP